MHQVGEMVQHLRGHEHTSGVGIVMSGWHIIAVTIDGSEARHSPVLELNDGKELKDSVLLLMHLISPAFTVLKTTWRAEAPIHQLHNISSTLPDDVIRQIIHFANLETYLSLRLVSRSVRLICLSHPRVGNHILLSYEGNSKSKPSFRVRSTSSTYSTIATLVHTKSSIEYPYPIWRFRAKHYSRYVLNPGLAGTFQDYQSGTGPLDARVGEENNKTTSQYFPMRLPFRDMIKGYVHHDMRIQTVAGIWEMVVGNAVPPIKIQDGSYQSTLYELMSGFDTDDLNGMSEVEKFHYLSD
ncbi:hypothetical protein B0J17DRAFT_681054 [Rhizoctonia solani]|nr:hypothetical protein B0J17DRAFT_681054 [Rhizoctonia solani]